MYMHNTGETKILVITSKSNHVQNLKLRF